MGNVFRVTPKRVRRVNGTILTPEMEVTVTTKNYTFNPFYNDCREVKDMYMRIYGFDYEKANCHPGDFDFKMLG